MGGPLTEEEIDWALNLAPNFKFRHAVETGTCTGTSTRMLARRFSQVFTIEIQKEYHDEAYQKGQEAGLYNIMYLLGDSCFWLPSIMEKISEPTLFFIDAHVSGSGSGWNSKDCVPLLQEAELILKNHKDYPAIFIFDDVRLFSKYWDWAKISKDSILAMFASHGKKVLHSEEKNDRFYVVI